VSHPFAGVRWIWMNGQLIEFEKATVHVMSHVIHYGSGVFEGIRCYKTPRGPAVFRLTEHMRRLESSAKVYRMPIPFSVQELSDAVVETIRANDFESCYIRPFAMRGFGPMGINPLRSPVEVVIAVWPWGRYLGEDACERGIDVRVSSWRRGSPDSLPALAKGTGNYLAAQLIKMEALADGYEEGIALDANGMVSEGSGENLFIVHEGALVTPPTASSLLPGITRSSILTLAKKLGIPVREEMIPRGLLYTCEEIFLTGTAAELTPVRSVDRIPVGTGCPGEVTRRLLDEFTGVVTGGIEDTYGWLTPVPVASPAGTRGLA
jgi:branched-chain amino acid aminotransferase